MDIVEDLLVDEPVIRLLREHLADMYATSPPESVHALDIEELKDPRITFWVAKDDGQVLGCAALKEIDVAHGEIKSMRTAPASRNRGVGSALLMHVVDEARRRGYKRVSLETGSMEFFAPARRLYERFGFEVCGPFASYRPDPNSTFMTLAL